MSGPYCYEYPRPGLTVDIVLFRRTTGPLEVLLIRRKQDPYRDRWAFPGGFVEIDEPLEAAAARELEEETGLTGVALQQVGAFGAPDRDPRGRTVSIAYGGVVESAPVVKGGDDAADARWFPADETPELAFDHSEMLDVARAKLKADD